MAGSIELLSHLSSAELEGFVRINARHRPMRVCHANEHQGETLALCGAGPSLRTARFDPTDQLWACNSALPWLVEHGVVPTAGVAIDQTPRMLEDWASVYPVDYLVASSVDPKVVQHLATKGRSVRFFHNAVGFTNDTWVNPDPEHLRDYEFALYCTAFPPTFVMGSGQTVVSRTIKLAFWMGFERIDVYGADCCLGPENVTHANGEDAEAAYGNPLLWEAEINGRHWVSRPDMTMDAVDLVHRVRESQGRVRLMGDTLPVALLGKSEAVLAEVCRRGAPDELSTTKESDDGRQE